MAPKPLPFTLRNAMRIALMSAIPAYAQMLIPLSPWAVLVHLFVVGTTFVSIAHFSGGTMSHFLALEIVYGLFICVVPAWGRHFLRMTWFGCNIDGWRAHIVYCVFVARKLTYFLPTNYGSNVEVLLPEYDRAYRYFRTSVGTFTGLLVCFALWSERYTWSDVVVAHGLMVSSFEYLCLVYANYVHLQKTGRTIRQDVWPYKDMFRKEWVRNERGERVCRIKHTFWENLERLDTGRTKDI